MSEEMLPADIFTRPRQDWKAEMDFRDLLTDEEELTPDQIKAKGQALAVRLEAQPLFEAQDTIALLKEVDNLDEFNSLLDQVWDECNRARIWVRFEGASTQALDSSLSETN